MYTIKQIPEDFIVKEIFDLSKKLKESGKFSYYKLRKRNYTTLLALQLVADKLHINPEKISFAGNKDKMAVTEQTIAIFGKGKELQGHGITLQFLGHGDETISLGEHQRNEFIITARNFDKKPSMRCIEYFPNFFDRQRFSKNNADIGKLLVRQDYKESVALLLEDKQEISGRMGNALKARPTDYIGALRLLPGKLLRLYVHSYQSLLWNKALQEFIGHQDTVSPEMIGLNIPILGFSTEFDNKTIEKIYAEIMDKEEVTGRDFISRSMPELSSAGAERKAFARIHGLQVAENAEDELNSGKQKITVKFELDKGCYATTALAYLFHAAEAD